MPKVVQKSSSLGSALNGSQGRLFLDGKKIERATNLLLEAIGVDTKSEDFVGTAKRVRRFWESLPQEEPVLTVFTNPSVDQLIVVEKMDFYCLCPHHVMPFMGEVSVGYLPSKKYAGLSKLARVIDWLAARPMTQEVLTEEIANYLQKKLKARALFVFIKAAHTCMNLRGVRKKNSITKTHALRGKEAVTLKQEFLQLIRE